MDRTYSDTLERIAKGRCKCPYRGCHQECEKCNARIAIKVLEAKSEELLKAVMNGEQIPEPQEL